MQITPEYFNKRFSALGLGPDGVASLLMFLAPLELNTDEALITHGQVSDTLFFLCSGRLRMTIDTGSAKLILGDIVPGRWVGEFGFIDPGKATASVTAQEASSVLALSHEKMSELQEKLPGTASELLQRLSLDLAKRLRETSRQVLIQNGDHRYALQNSTDEPLEDEIGLLGRIRKLFGTSGGY